METLTRCLAAAAAERAVEAPLPPLPRHARLVLLSDFLLPPERLSQRLGQFGALGARASLMQIVDPAEEHLPYEGRVLFEGMEHEGTALIDHVGGIRVALRRAVPRASRDAGRPRPAGRAGGSPRTGPTARRSWPCSG